MFKNMLKIKLVQNWILEVAWKAKYKKEKLWKKKPCESSISQ